MRIQVPFGSRHILLAAIVLGALVSLATLTSGLFLDDYQQRIALLSGGNHNVFEFYHRGTIETEAQMQAGVLPWWLYPDSKIIFYRPVAQWLMQLDYRFWPNNLPLMHLHSVLWYGVAVLVVGLCYRRLMPTRWAAGFAAVLFALDAAHGPAVGWLANRSGLVGLAGAFLCLLCYQQRQRYWQIVGYFLFALSLACSEGALAITGYLLAYEACLSDRRWFRGTLRLLPYALIAIVWLAFWKYRGFGTSGPGFYIDPANDPLLFVTEMFYRVPAYIVGQFFLPPADVFIVTEDWMHAYALAYALLVTTLLAWLLMPLLRACAPARFYVLGMLVAVIPICGSLPVSRSLLYVGFGASGLLGLFIEQFGALQMPNAQRRCSAAFAGTMTVLHLWIAPLLFIAYSKECDVGDRFMDSRRVQLPDTGASGRKILALSTSSYITTITFPILKDAALSLGTAPTRPAPSIARIRALTEGEGEFELLHQDADTLVVRCAAGLGALRPSRYGFRPGERVVLDDVEVLVQSVSPAGAPKVIEYHFNPGVLGSYEIITWQGDHFVPASLPAIGQRVTMSVKTTI